MVYKNVKKDMQITYDGGKTLTVKKGYYNIEHFIDLFEKVGCKLQADKNNRDLKILEMEGKAVTIPPELLALFGIKRDSAIAGKSAVEADHTPHLTPLSLYVYLDELDRDYNLFNGSPSNLLAIIPLKNSPKFGDIVNLEPNSCFKKLAGTNINRLKFTIKDEEGQEMTIPDVIIELECF